MKRGQSGFTLMEILVVLVLVSLISTVMLQALGYVFGIQRRVGVQLWEMQKGAMSADWFRLVVRGLQPDFYDGKNKFHGTENEFSGLTTNPLAAEYGAISPFTFALRYSEQNDETTLSYGAKPGDPRIMSWPGQYGKFVYVDAKGAAHDSWPPALGLWPQLPSVIKLQAIEDGGHSVIVASPSGPTEPLPRLRDLIGGIF